MAIPQTRFRSISLPSRLHPKSTDCENHLQELKSLQISADSSEAIQSALLKIAELYMNSLQQKTVVLDNHQDEAESSLSASVELLDCCGAIREVVQLMKESVQALQSALRRKGAMEYSSIRNDIASYLCCRKRMNKSMAKILKTLKKSEAHMMKKNGLSDDFSSGFRELNGITTAILKGVVVFFLSSRQGGWSLVSKITKCDVASEVANVELAVSELQKMRSIDGGRVVDVQKRLQNVEGIIEGLEGGLERLFRQLVQIRVTLLNILTDY